MGDFLVTDLLTRRAAFATLTAPLLAAAAANRIGWDRISVLTDEIADSPDNAFAFIRQYGLKAIELRAVPGRENRIAGKREYWQAPGPELKNFAARLREDGLRVTFLNTGLLKFTMPGTEYISRRNEAAEAREKRLAQEQLRFENRFNDLRTAIEAAHILDVRAIRVFTFLRVTEPESLLPKITEVLGPMGEMAAKAGVQLLVENESSCNTATSAELAAVLRLLPEKSFGGNWDPHNCIGFGEKPYPNGYALLPAKRIGNVQIKGKSMLQPGEILDWAGIKAALERDGYRGALGLETHYFDGTLIEKSHRCVQELLRMTAKS
jgi:L-ribulose-5-phosphate 3-epimerase